MRELEIESCSPLLNNREVRGEKWKVRLRHSLRRCLPKRGWGAIKRGESAGGKGREAAGKVGILPGFVKIQAGFIKISA